MEKKNNMESIRALTLLQPKSIVFGQYEFSEIQENILTLIIEQLQKFMTKDEVEPMANLSMNLFGQAYIEIDCEEAGGERNKAIVLRNAKDLTNKKVNYTYTSPKDGRVVEHYGNMISAVETIKGTNLVRIIVDNGAIPFLLYYGRGVGATLFDKRIALRLRGSKVKRLYKMICSYADKGRYEYPIDKFIEDFELGPGYTNKEIKKYIMDVAKKKIDEIGSDVTFDYEMVTLHPLNNGRKPKADTIVFYIKSAKRKSEQQMNEHNYIYNMLQWVFGYSSDAVKYYDKIIESGQAEHYRKKLEYYDDLVSAGKMTPEHAKNTIKKILRDELSK